MFFWEKLRRNILAVLPFVLLTCVLHGLLEPDSFADGRIAQFIVGGLLLSAGMSLFLFGVDIGIIPMAHKAGSELAARRSLPILAGLCFAAGFFITLAEPHLGLLEEWTVRLSESSSHLLTMLAVGVGGGIFLALAAGRIILQFSLKKFLVLSYLLAFGGVALAEASFPGLLFGVGGAATGPIAVPFVLALGVGMAAVRGGSGARDDSFGLLGCVAVGPVLAMIVLELCLPGDWSTSYFIPERQGEGILFHFLTFFPQACKETAIAVLPLLVLLILFGTTLFNLSRLQVIRFTKGLLYSFLGLCLFFMGLRGGFLEAGDSLGGLLAEYGQGFCLVFGMLFSAVLAPAEPTVWVLSAQAEAMPGGQLSKRHLLGALCLSAFCAAGLAVFQAFAGFSLWYILAPGYALALLLTWRCPDMFTALAFDSGAVLIGPVACTFMLSFISSATFSLSNGFGVIALFAMTPLILLQIFGILFQRRRQAL